MDHDYIDMPLVVRSNQNTPHFTGEVIEGILANTKGYKQMFCALLAEKGFALEKHRDLRSEHISADFRTLYIRQKV